MIQEKKLRGAIIPISISTCKLLSHSEKFVLIYLIQLDNFYYNQNGFFHSYAQFAEELDCAKGFIVSHLKSLEKKGFISSKREKGRKATEFIINYDKIAELSKYAKDDEKVVEEQPVVQEVKEKLIETRSITKAVVPEIPQQKPETEPVKEEQPVVNTIHQTEEKEPENKVNPFAGMPQKKYPNYPSRLYYPEDRDKMNEVYSFLYQRARQAEQAGFVQLKSKEAGENVMKVLKATILYQDFDCLQDLRESKIYNEIICKKYPELLMLFTGFFKDLGKNIIKKGKDRKVSLSDYDRLNNYKNMMNYDRKN